MDRLIINGIKQLYVLKPYHSNSMDELSRDLTTALDESSDRRIHEGKVKRSKSWKCRSKSKCGLMLGSSVPKSSTKSEDSESSLDNWIQQQMDFSTNGSYQHTDSDDIIYKVNQRSYHLTSWRHCTPNMGESDSVNENLHPSREPRRKRKFKRMTVDPPSVAEQDFATLPSIASFSSFSQKSKRPRSLKAHKISKLLCKSPKLSKTTVSQLSAEMENICKEFGNAASSSGKRKRCAHERSIECTGCDCKEFISTKGNMHACRLSTPCHHLKYINVKSQEISSSGLSSSESDHDILNNEESREADDEQSDFFQESGPTCGVPNISPWWEDDDFIPDEKQISDPKFQDLLCESFHDMSETAKTMYAMQFDKYKSGRQIRSGRRRLGKGMSPINVNSDELLPYMASKNDKSCLSLNADSCFTKTTPNEKKKRKGMSPATVPIYGYGELTGGCVSDSNLGFQVLKKMGWKPGAGLGRLEGGILSPNKATANDGKPGLGFLKNKNENIFPSPITYRNPSQSPPPPPPSPQSVFVKNDSSA